MLNAGHKEQALRFAADIRTLSNNLSPAVKEHFQECYVHALALGPDELKEKMQEAEELGVQLKNVKTALGYTAELNTYCAEMKDEAQTKLFKEEVITALAKMAQ